MSLNYKYLSDVKREDASFILASYMPIPKNAVTLLSASGGTGKTRLSLLMANRHIQDTGERVALWLTEDYPGQVRATFDDMVKAGLAKADSMSKMLLIINQPPQLAKRENGIFKANYDEITSIGQALIVEGVTFAVFDPLLAFYGGNENDNSEARVFIQTFAEWAKKAEITSLIIHHANKDGASRGATAFHDGVRCRYELSMPLKDNGDTDNDIMKKGLRKATLKKDNWGVRKPLWKITDGNDDFMIKIMPEMETNKSFDVEVTDFKDNNFLGGIA